MSPMSPMSTASLFTSRTSVPHPPTAGRGGAYQLALTLRGAWPFVPFPASVTTGDGTATGRHDAADVTDVADAAGPAPVVADAAQLALELS